MYRLRTWILIVASIPAISGCFQNDRYDAFDRLASQPLPLSIESTPAIGKAEPIRPLPVVDKDSLHTPMVALGRQLFHDKRLSGDNTLNCASCHAIDQGGDDNLPTSRGIRGQMGPINAPTVLNSGFNFRQFWDGRAESLDEQANGPVAADIEMGADWDSVVATLREDKEYQSQFEAAFGTQDITQAKIVHAIARYEETLTTPSPFDRYLDGDANAISDSAKEGYASFKMYGCSSCHQGINVGGNLYQQFGALQHVDVDAFVNEGAKPEIRKREEDVSLVKVPSLRNIELTSPYFHAGLVKDLDTAVRIMGLSQIGISLPEDDVTNIVAFLKTLTGNWQQHAALID